MPAALMIGETLAVVLLSFAPGDPLETARGAPNELSDGWSADDRWHGAWRRILDRTGRPDPHGPLLQPAQYLQRPEYLLSTSAGDFPMRFERDWDQRSRGARMWMHSDDEFTFMNRVQIKERVPMGKHAALGIRFDRQDDRVTRSDLLRVDFAFPDMRGSGAFLELRGYLRFEKPDLDLDIVTGWKDARFGRAALHIYSVDTFNNASDGLALSRAVPLPLRTIQQKPSFGTALELKTWRFGGIRAETYLGALLPSPTRFQRVEKPEDDHVRTQAALFGGALVEWKPKSLPLWLGFSPSLTATRHRGERDDGSTIYDAPERQVSARAYALAKPHQQIELEGFVEHSRTILGGEGLAFPVADRDWWWMTSLRANWMPTRVFGLEARYLWLHRRAIAQNPLLEAALRGSDHRLVSRFLLRFSRSVWVAFGVGWDLDDPTNRYDQGIMTMIIRW